MSGAQFIQKSLALNISKKADFVGWYNQVVVKSEMIESYNVPGLYTIRPWAFSIWEFIQDYIGGKFLEMNVKNVSLPLFVPFMSKLGERYNDLAPHTTFLTYAGGNPIEYSVAIRPTSESLVYSDFGRWCRSWRDLPFKINHWCNAVRWHKNPIPFILSREFLLQEGYNGFINREEATNEVYKILDIYTSIYCDLFAIPVLKGRKSEKGKLFGSDFSTSLHIVVPTNGIGIQGASSTHLGQYFSKKFDLYFDNPKKPGEKEYIWLTRYTLSIRSIGALVMVHGDDFGLILPPKVAPIQVVIIANGILNSNKNITEIGDKLRKFGLRVEVDNREELKGVPIILEINPEYLKRRQILSIIRFNNQRTFVGSDNLAVELKYLLEKIHCDMLKTKTDELNKIVEICLEWKHFLPSLEKQSVLLSPFCGRVKCEQWIETNSQLNNNKIKLLNIPFEQPNDNFDKKCINPNCKKKAEFFALFGQYFC